MDNPLRDSSETESASESDHYEYDEVTEPEEEVDLQYIDNSETDSESEPDYVSIVPDKIKPKTVKQIQPFTDISIRDLQQFEFCHLNCIGHRNILNNIFYFFIQGDYKKNDIQLTKEIVAYLYEQFGDDVYDDLEFTDKKQALGRLVDRKKDGKIRILNPIYSRNKPDGYEDSSPDNLNMRSICSVERLHRKLNPGVPITHNSNQLHYEIQERAHRFFDRPNNTIQSFKYYKALDILYRLDCDLFIGQFPEDGLKPHQFGVINGIDKSALAWFLFQLYYDNGQNVEEVELVQYGRMLMGEFNNENIGTYQITITLDDMRPLGQFIEGDENKKLKLYRLLDYLNSNWRMFIDVEEEETVDENEEKEEEDSGEEDGKEDDEEDAKSEGTEFELEMKKQIESVSEKRKKDYDKMMEKIKENYIEEEDKGKKEIEITDENWKKVQERLKTKQPVTPDQPLEKITKTLKRIIPSNITNDNSKGNLE